MTVFPISRIVDSSLCMGTHILVPLQESFYNRSVYTEDLLLIVSYIPFICIVDIIQYVALQVGTQLWCMMPGKT